MFGDKKKKTNNEEENIVFNENDEKINPRKSKSRKKVFYSLFLLTGLSIGTIYALNYAGIINLDSIISSSIDYFNPKIGMNNIESDKSNKKTSYSSVHSVHAVKINQKHINNSPQHIIVTENINSVKHMTKNKKLNRNQNEDIYPVSSLSSSSRNIHHLASKHTVNKNIQNIVINKTALSVPDKVLVKKNSNGVKIIFEDKDRKNLETINKTVALLKKEISTLKKQNDDMQNIIKKEMKQNNINNLQKDIIFVKNVISKLNVKVDKYQENIQSNQKEIASLEKEFNELKNQINELNNKFLKVSSLLNKEMKQKNISSDNNVSVKIDRLSKKMSDTIQEVNKLKNIFENNVKINIKMAKEFDSLKKKIFLIENEFEKNHKNLRNNSEKTVEQSNNLLNETKDDDINKFGFYYAGYETDDNNIFGYIEDAKGKLYKIEKGSLINYIYKIEDIKPLYMKIKDLRNGKEYIISYKR